MSILWKNLPAKVLDMNEIGVCNISLSSRIAFDAYDDDPVMGGFVIVDRMTNNTVGMGLIDFALRRADNIHWQSMDVTKQSRAEQKSQRPRLIWFTGYQALENRLLQIFWRRSCRRWAATRLLLMVIT